MQSVARGLDTVVKYLLMSLTHSSHIKLELLLFLYSIMTVVEYQISLITEQYCHRYTVSIFNNYRQMLNAIKSLSYIIAKLN